jgi:hypothetical protein
MSSRTTRLPCKLSRVCRFLVGLCVALGLLVFASRADTSSTNQLCPGVRYFSETRKVPPTRLFVAEIDLTNPQVQIRVAPGGSDPDGPGPWQTTLMQPTSIGTREGFSLVVNGDFFRARGVKDAEGTNSTYRAELWGAATGPAVTDGKLWSTSNSNRPCLVVRKDGKAAIQMLAKPGTEDWEVVSGNTMLVRAGAVVPHENKVRHPRTVVGLNAAGSKLFLVVVDGRKPGVAVGMNYDELAAEMIRLGCQDALNLDGGGSSVMAIRDPATAEFRILNQPTDGRERAVANVLGISLREPERSQAKARQ